MACRLRFAKNGPGGCWMNSSSRAMRPRGLSHRISARGKFTAQSLQEKRLSLPVGMLNDRDKINRPRSQSSRLACARMQGYVRRCWHLGPRPTPSGSTGLARSTASSNSWSHPSFTRQRRPRNRNHSDKPQKTCGPGCKAAKPQSLVPEGEDLPRAPSGAFLGPSLLGVSLYALRAAS